MRWKLCGNKSEWQKKGNRTAEKGVEKLRHGNQQRRKRGMGTTKHGDIRDMEGGNRKKGCNGKKKESLSKDPAWKTGGECVRERKQDGNGGIKVAKGRDRWTI